MPNLTSFAAARLIGCSQAGVWWRGVKAATIASDRRPTLPSAAKSRYDSIVAILGPRLDGAVNAASPRLERHLPFACMTTEPLIRPAESTDAAAIAEVWLRSSKAALPAVHRAHPGDDVRGWIRDVLVPAGTVSVVEVNTTVVGLLALASGWIEQLYVDPDWQRRGIGARLVGLAKRQEPSGLQLWTFQINRRAQQFYERHGFAAVEWTDGSTNEEREPDVRDMWPGRMA